MFEFPHTGLYVITTSKEQTAHQFLAGVEAAIDGGAKVVQFRDKQRFWPRSTVRTLLALCHTKQVPLIINDDIDLAADLGADGIHLGREDAAIQTAKRRLGATAIVGLSCYDSLERALFAQAQGASYVAFGRFFPSRSKPQASPAPLELLSRTALAIPVVAIGGITPSNGAALLDAGADLLAVIDGVFGSGDPKRAATAYRKLFQRRDQALKPDR